MHFLGTHLFTTPYIGRHLKYTGAGASPLLFLTHTKRTGQEESAQICALIVHLCLLLELIYDRILVSKTSRNWWYQGDFRPKLFGFAAVAASRHNESCDGSGPRGLGFESRHSDQKMGIRTCGFPFLIDMRDSKSLNRHMPLAYGCHQFENWWLQ